MSTPELQSRTAEADTQMLSSLLPINRPALKNILTVLLGGSGEFFPEELQEIPGVIDWAQWDETSSLRAEWVEQARLEGLQWLRRMEYGCAEDDAPIGATAVRATYRVLDVPSFIPAWPTGSDEDIGSADTVIIDLATRRHELETVEPQHDSSESLPPDQIEFMRLLTRAELVDKYAETHATTKVKLPTCWRLLRTIQQDARHRGLADDEEFLITLKSYEANGRHGFVSWVREMVQHDGYSSAVYQKARAKYLEELGATELLATSTSEVI